MNLLQSGCNIILAASTQADSMNKYSKALLNTALGLIIVFAVLIFISILIYLIRFIPIIIDNFTNKNKSNETTFLQDNSQVNAQFTVIEEEVLEIELVDNSELVAVITAAIMASMGNDAPADGLFVRSIRRTNGKRWQNA